MWSWEAIIIRIRIEQKVILIINRYLLTLIKNDRHLIKLVKKRSCYIFSFDF